MLTLEISQSFLCKATLLGGAIDNVLCIVHGGFHYLRTTQTSKMAIVGIALCNGFWDRTVNLGENIEYEFWNADVILVVD